MICDSDIEPDQLVPDWLQTKTKLLRLEHIQKQSGHDPQDLEVEKLGARLFKIENDVLFDKHVAEQEWRSRRPILERELAQARREREAEDREKEKKTASQTSTPPGTAADDIANEAERMAAKVLAEAAVSDDDDNYGAMTDLFANLPVLDVDPVSGKSSTVVNTPNGRTIAIRDFGKWNGVSPMRILEEACRARYFILGIFPPAQSTSNGIHDSCLGIRLSVYHTC